MMHTRWYRLLRGLFAVWGGLCLLMLLGNWLNGMRLQWSWEQREHAAAGLLIEALQRGTLQCTNVPIQVTGSLDRLTVLAIPHVPLSSLVEIRADPGAVFLVRDWWVGGFQTPVLFRPALQWAENYVEVRPPEWLSGSGSGIAIY